MKLWFKAKTYGWGWYPVSWEGWLVTGVFAALAALPAPLLASLGFVNDRTGLLFTLVFLLYIALITALLLWVCYRTGEKPRWRWGD